MSYQPESFDYVIVGAGSAGCVLANRLTEDANTTVCLVEAGGSTRRSLLVNTPAGIPFLQGHRKFDWKFLTAPQAGASARTVNVPRGRALGGTSTINGMVYMRGHASDYDDWAAAGNDGWSYAEVLPYFKKSEDNERFGDNPYHGGGGPMRVSDIRPLNPLIEVFLEATDSLQFPRNDDFNGASQDGFGDRQVTVRDGRRESTATAFLDPVLDRPNLHVISGVLADKVIVAGGRAEGIEIIAGGERRTVNARREVVLSAGSVASPAILLRSGIGPAEELARLDIPVTLDAPGVGRNLQEHPAISNAFSSPSTLTYGLSLRAAPKLAWNGIKYAFTRRGMFASNLIEGGGFIRTRPDLPRPDIQYTFLPGHRGPAGHPVSMGHGFVLTTILLRPKSRGSLTLASPEPQAPPVIDYAVLTAPADLDGIMEGFKIGRRILEAPAFAPYRGNETRPGTHVRDDKGLEGYIRDNVVTVFHPVGTCAMGTGPMAVVDPQLRVRGLAGLRVVDAAVMPSVIGGNTNAPTIMIAEKAADMIRGRPPLPPADLPSTNGVPLAGHAGHDPA